MWRAIRVGVALTIVGSAASCGDDRAAPMEPEFVTTPPPPVLSGRVLVADSFFVPATEANFRVDRYSGGGTLPTDVGPTLVQVDLSLRKLGEPGVTIGWELILVEQGGGLQATSKLYDC